MKTQVLFKRFSIALVALGSAFGGYLVARAASPAVATPPVPLYYSGTLVDGGAPATGAHPIKIEVFATATSTTALCMTASTETLVAGRFSVALDASCAPALQTANQSAFVAVTVDGNALGARQQIGATPFALTAGQTTTAILGSTQTLVAGDGVDPNHTSAGGGYQSLTTICRRELGPKASPCTMSDAVQSMARGSFGTARMDDTDWVIGAPSLSTQTATDNTECTGFSDATGSFASAIHFDTPATGHPQAQSCSTPAAILCCGTP